MNSDEAPLVKALTILAAVAASLVGFWFYWASSGVSVATWWLGQSELTSVQKAGAWGDTFGAFNALVSTIASAAILATLWLQFKSSSDQSKDLHRQRFESRFFELLKLIREVRSEIVFRHSEAYIDARRSFLIASLSAQRNTGFNNKSPLRGHDGIRAAVVEFRYWIAPGRLPNSRSPIVKIYEDRIHKNNETSFGPYFRLVYTILKRISVDTLLTPDEKALYGNLLRSQLTSEELTLLAVNGMAPFSNDMQNLIKEFRLLKYLPDSSVKRRFVRFYGASAFAPRD